MAPEKDSKNNFTEKAKDAGSAVKGFFTDAGAKIKRALTPKGKPAAKEAGRDVSARPETGGAPPEKPAQPQESIRTERPSLNGGASGQRRKLADPRGQTTRIPVVKDGPRKVGASAPSAPPAKTRPANQTERKSAPPTGETQIIEPVSTGAPRKSALSAAAKKAGVAEETVIFSDDALRQANHKAPLMEHTQVIPNVARKKGVGSLFKSRDKKPNFVLGVILTIVKLGFVAIVVVVAVGFGSIMGVANAYLETTPTLDAQKISEQNLSSKIYDKDGSLLATYTGAENRDWAALSEIPDDLQNAVIAIEDERFWTHDGVDFRRIGGAFVANLVGSSSGSGGGSTITQQLIKNKLLSNERSYKRKLQEAVLATELEKEYSKEEILEWYLNTIPLGGRVYGVKTAAKDYFGKELSQLNLREMVCIAAITQKTTQFNPRRATYSYPEKDLPYLVDRMNIITERMLAAGTITRQQYDETYITNYLDETKSYTDEDGVKHLFLRGGFLDEWTADMKILPESPANELYKYPHFVEYAVEQVKTFMLRQNALEDTAANRAKMDYEMRSGGYQIYTTIDPAVQETVQETLSSWEDYPSFKNAKDNVIYSKDNNGNPIEITQPQAAAVVVDNREEYSGYLRAIVGSREAPDAMKTFNRANDGTMQIGSSIKPIAVYGPAFDNGYGLASGVANIPVPITGWTEEPGYPTTSSDRTGPISMHDAIVYSQNTAAARTLADYVGIDTSAQHLVNLGVDPKHLFDDSDPENVKDQRNLVGLALGAAPVTPIEVAGAYATIERGGEYLEPISFTKVVDSKKNVVIDAEELRERRQAFKPSTAYMLNVALEDAVDHGTGTRADIEGMTTAGKTGTVTRNRGAFFAGYTPYYTSSLWVGSDKWGPEFQGGSGGSICAPIWNAYMTRLHEALTDKPVFDLPPESYGLVEADICLYSNMKAGPGCDRVSHDWMAIEDVPGYNDSGLLINEDGSVTDTSVCNVCTGRVVVCEISNMLAGPYCQYLTERGGKNFPPGSPYLLWNPTVTTTDPWTGEVTTTGGWGGGGYINEPCNVCGPWTGWDEPQTPAEPAEPVDPGAGGAVNAPVHAH